jgi:protein-S-isoprenylcysteine O-methyltransferase Ste14
MMLRFTTARASGASRPWPWPARIPALIFAYGGAILAVLTIERLMHSATSAGYAAIAVVPGGVVAGICAFALSFRPRARLFVLAAVVVVALLPLGVIAVSYDFREYRELFEQRALLLAPILAAAIAVVTSVLIAGGVFPAREAGATR